jgi:hypothetical protein
MMTLPSHFEPCSTHFIEQLTGKTVSEAATLAKQAGFFIAREDQLSEPERFRLDRVVLAMGCDGLVKRAFVR